MVTNLRFADGRKPGFIDRADSWFLFPLSAIRFIEVPLGTMSPADERLALPAGTVMVEPDDDDEDGRFSLDELDDEEDLLRRIREA
jgi:hypothetical protein